MNNDGLLDLLITNHSDDADVNGVFVFERISLSQPCTSTSAWRRHKIAGHYPVSSKGVGNAAPGNAQAFWPQTSMQSSTKPWIVLSGTQLAMP